MSKNAGPTDVAALAGGAVATAISLAASSGAYDWLSLVTSSSLLLIIFAYVWPHKRNRLQSFAAAGAIAISAIPGVGFILETLFELNGRRASVGDSLVNPAFLAAAWLGITSFGAWWDIRHQPR